jgi:hypothetical protein
MGLENHELTGGGVEGMEIGITGGTETDSHGGVSIGEDRLTPCQFSGQVVQWRFTT